ncbi:RpiR family transcriptional regulator [Streptomyces sp. BK340]|nr:RpiR family transcriptional regulator [Streptomyces sp. BK340]
MTRRAGERSDRLQHAAEADGASGAGMDTKSGTTVAERLRRLQDRLSPAVLKIARALTANYPAAGLDSASGLASYAGVSAPTVVRFVARLGFNGYRHFQQPGLGQPVQMVRGERARHPGRLGGLVAAASRPWAATYSYRRRRTGSCNAAIASMSCTRTF